MGSHYDPVKKCRVGTMDEKQFYSEADKLSGAYFKSLIAAWGKRDGMLKWGAGGIGLRSTLSGKETGICFVAPQYAGKKDRIELSLTTLGKQVGAARAEKLKAALQRAAGANFKGSSMVSIVDPGQLPAAGQKDLTAALIGML